jgi:hypothetical protein
LNASEARQFSNEYTGACSPHLIHRNSSAVSMALSHGTSSAVPSPSRPNWMPMSLGTESYHEVSPEHAEGFYRADNHMSSGQIHDDYPDFIHNTFRAIKKEPMIAQMADDGKNGEDIRNDHSLRVQLLSNSRPDRNQDRPAVSVAHLPRHHIYQNFDMQPQLSLVGDDKVNPRYENQGRKILYAYEPAHHMSPTTLESPGIRTSPTPDSYLWSHHPALQHVNDMAYSVSAQPCIIDPEPLGTADPHVVVKGEDVVCASTSG